MNSGFYSNLPLIEDLKEITNNSMFYKVPEDWFLIVSDIKESTKNIEKGRYKDINIIGALTIISILNINKEIEIPFIFGGDGAFLLIPKMLLKEATQALICVKELSKENYDLDLRVGVIALSEIYKESKVLYIAKYLVSKDYHQAVIKGGALEFADNLLKSSDKYWIKDKKDENFILDTSGLECRWEAIKSHKNETLSILIKAIDESYYEELFENLEKILGKNRHPIFENNLILSFDNKNLDSEASLYSKSKLKKFFIKFKLKFINFIGLFLMAFKIGEWGNYKKRILSTSDSEKFDDMLRMVVSSSYSQTKALEEYLEKEYKNKKLIYGIHKSKETLMTCLIFQRHGKHVHFIDGANGGYASASKAFKKRVLNLDES